ncbi:hypothetical protein OS188_08245 [Xanthomarina sp. F1114]|uniref:hypothetical protein n=1 Tax=Xanthomarina sp. F1114 TaxID=2996019 RepID=UPI00225DE6AD|nr:hypothetical protein [Xanthomarina sp. F1114]MCX7547942.1 hypothetical protein [Xanthomarina sp. F1114]
MKNFLPFIFFLILSFATAQNNERIEISGKAIVEANDVEGLTVNNITSNRIAVTDLEGKFKIYVKLNDRIRISALQLNSVLVIITQDILDSKELTVFLDEHLTPLDEVVILPFSLTGDLETDLTNVRGFNPKFESIYFGDIDFEHNPMADIYYEKVENTILNQDRFYNGVDFVKLTNWLIKPLFGDKKASNKSNELDKSNYEVLRETYTKDFISSSFNIPEDKVSEFVAFAELNNTDPSLYEKGNDIELIEYLVNQSKLFLETEAAKN